MGKNRFWFLVSGFSLTCSAFGQSPINSTIHKLQAIHVNEMDVLVSTKLASLHQKLKRELRDFIIDALNRDADVDAELARAGVRIGPVEGRSPYGQIRKVKVERKPNGLSTWVAFTTTIDVNCGEDSSLYLLQHERDGWQLRFAMESILRLEVANAQLDLQYVVSQADPGGNFFVVVAKTNTWCTSCLRKLRYEVFALDASGAPSIVLTKNTDIYGCNDPPYKLSLQNHLFALEYYWVGPGGMKTLAVSYSVEGNSAKRVAPELKP